MIEFIGHHITTSVIGYSVLCFIALSPVVYLLYHRLFKDEVADINMLFFAIGGIVLHVICTIATRAALYEISHHGGEFHNEVSGWLVILYITIMFTVFVYSLLGERKCD